MGIQSTGTPAALRGRNRADLAATRAKHDGFFLVNRLLNNWLILGMSTCEGYAGIRMAMHADEETQHAYYTIIGNGANQTWPETAVAFATLYHQLACVFPVDEAVKAMRAASGNEKFFIESASNTRESHIDYVRKLQSSGSR
jgi:hypothetical protein